jgi:hypothetical protein
LRTSLAVCSAAAFPGPAGHEALVTVPATRTASRNRLLGLSVRLHGLQPHALEHKDPAVLLRDRPQADLSHQPAVFHAFVMPSRHGLVLLGTGSQAWQLSVFRSRT